MKEEWILEVETNMKWREARGSQSLGQGFL